ncbi:HAD family hydrolase [Companilactobacillus muriivasis]|uniref:HAD family hydrolase n=1 Tax=Companilactobacillus muriivasis TaxID=3081444 RepID=UPI0030C6C8FF
MKGSGLDKYFDDYFISEDIGFSKPSAEFFKPVFQRHPNLNKDNALMIGDRLQSDVLGANRAGLNSIWFNPRKQINNSEIQPTFVANNFQQVREIVRDEK